MMETITSIQQATLNIMLGTLHSFATCPISDQEIVGRYLSRISELPTVKSVLGEESCLEDASQSEVGNPPTPHISMRQWLHESSL